MVKLANPLAHTIAFEPQPNLKEKLARNRHVDRIHGVALSDVSGTATLSVLNETATISPDFYNGSTTNSQVVVETRTLDSLCVDLNSIFMIKLDVDGHEPSVIRGGQVTLAKTRYLITEAMSADHMEEIRRTLPGRWTSQRLDFCNWLFEQCSTATEAAV